MGILPQAKAFNPQHCDDSVLEGRKDCHSGWAVRETKEQLGIILVLEARDLNHAIQFISTSRSEAWTLRGTSGGGFERNDPGRRAAAEEHRVMGREVNGAGN
jgi:hypothetical protein